MSPQDSKQELLQHVLLNPQAEPELLPLQLFEDITEDFSNHNIIGRGTFGVVYKGSLQDGSKVAVKKLIDTHDSNTEFSAEVDCLKKVKHRNIVGSLGYCDETREVVVQYKGKKAPTKQQERLLCFEYVSKGSLQDHIKDKLHGLEWQMTYEIIMGVCLGLDYLHTERSICHLDLKPDNILLDENMVPKITDFGLSRHFSDRSIISTMRAAGTQGYMAPEIGKGRISRKADVYSLGVIIIELLTGSKEPPSSIETVHKNWRHKLCSELHRKDDIFLQAYNQISACTEIALMSVQDEPEDRRTISEILEILRSNRSFQTRAMEFMDPYSTGDMFNNDEKPIDPGSNKAKPQPGFTDDDGGRVSVKANHSKAAPLEATTVSVQLEVTSSSSVAGRAPLDLVMALDVGNSMCDGANLDQFKSAIDFFIRRVSPMDRLSIVSFSDVANRVCPLIAMSEVGKFYVMGTVDGLMASSSRGANVKAGLETAVEVLASRQYTAGRVGHILLLSDGHEDHGDARLVSIPCDIPIYTLAFGVDANMVLLQNLAQNGRMFNFVPDIGAENVLLSVFSQLMISLLQVAVEDLYVILSNPNSPDHDLDMIVKVASDSIHQETNRRLGTVTIKLAGLLCGQVRKVDAELLLFEADHSDYEVDILDISVSYPNTEGIRHIYKVQTLHITRSNSADHTSSSSLAALEKLP